MPKEISSMPFGSKLKILAEVTERATGTKEFATDNSVHIVKSPFIISFEKTAKYFKPGINFKVVVLYNCFIVQKLTKIYLILHIDLLSFAIDTHYFATNIFKSCAQKTKMMFKMIRKNNRHRSDTKATNYVKLL